MKNSKNILIFLGFFMLSIFIWFRFIRKRLPREIPFNLSFLAMLILIIICIMYIYILYIHFEKKKKLNTKSIGNIILQTILVPLKEFDKFIISSNKVKFLHTRTLLFLANFMKNREKQFVIFFTIIPRLFLVCVLFLDIFYFHKFSIFYKIILISLLILIGKYIEYSLEILVDKLIDNNYEYITINMEYEYGIQIIEDSPPEDEDEEDFIPDTMCIPLKEFIYFQTFYYQKNKKYLPYNAYTSGKGFESYRKEKGYNKSINLTVEDRKYLKEEKETLVSNILELHVFLNNIHEFSNSREIKNIKILIFGNFLLFWFYILIISLPYLHFDIFFYSLLKSSFIEKPF